MHNYSSFDDLQHAMWHYTVIHQSMRFKLIHLEYFWYRIKKYCAWFIQILYLQPNMFSIFMIANEKVLRVVHTDPLSTTKYVFNMYDSE